MIHVTLQHHPLATACYMSYLGFFRGNPLLSAHHRFHFAEQSRAVQLLFEFFTAGGDGLPLGIVENAFAPVEQLVKLYHLETQTIIENLMHAGDQISMGTDPQRYGIRSASDADTLLRVLCHRSDKEASKFLKKHYRLPKSAAYDDTPGREASPISPFSNASMSNLLKRSTSLRWGADGQKSLTMLKQKIQEATVEFRQGGW